MNTDLRKLGMNKETAKLTWEHLSKSGPAAAVAISATLLYFAGTVWSCLGCGPVRTILLTIIAWFSQCFILYSAAKQECAQRFNAKIAGTVALRAIYPTIAFTFGYVIVPWFLPTPLSFLSKIGPTKVIIPAATGGLLMIATNYILGKYIQVKEICPPK